MTSESVDLLCVKGVQRGDGRGIGVGRCLRRRPLRAPVGFPVGHGGSVEGSLRTRASGVEAEARVNSFGGRCSDAGGRWDLGLVEGSRRRASGGELVGSKSEDWVRRWQQLIL